MNDARGFHKHFRMNLTAARKKYGFPNKSALAQRAGMTIAEICRLENNLMSNPSLATILRIADVMDCSIEDLIKRV